MIAKEHWDIHCYQMEKRWQNPNITKIRPSTRSNNQGQKVNCQRNDQKPATRDDRAAEFFG